MTRIEWGSFGSRIYETGIDKVVFYPDSGPGLPWNGVVSFTETPSFEVSRRFIDGVPYRTQKTRTEFSGKLQAFSSPQLFDDYDGTSGLRPQSFGMIYRTRIANAETEERSYQIHILYNVLAKVGGVEQKTIDSSLGSATVFSWDLSAKPVKIPDASPAAHFIIDSTIIYPEALEELENVLYGSDTTDPYLPDISDLMDLFEKHSILMIVDHGDGTWSAIGPDDIVSIIDDDNFTISWPSVVPIDLDTYIVSSL